jgi:hypothetical protein
MTLKAIRKNLARFSLGEYLLFILFFIFSSTLMWKTFRVDLNGNIQIATKAWSDFAATIPLIRSFSLGSNFPPEYPIFAGSPIRYHFGFFAAVGLLEKLGMRLDWALNTLSVLSFFLLLFMIYLVGKKVFKSKSVGIVAVVLFLFNGSFGFLEFFKLHPVSPRTFSDIVNNTAFSSFGPYDGKIVSAFWSLNIFTNQRHLALAYGVFLLFLLLIFKYSEKSNNFTIRKSVFLGVFLGLFPFVHLSAFIMTGISLCLFLLVYPKIRKQIIIIGVIALTFAIPQFLFMGKAQIEAGIFHPGYLITNLTTKNFLEYWFINLGLTIVLAPIGFKLANREQRKTMVPFVIFFAIGNLFQLSPEIASNHKFFNLFVIGINMFTALLLIKVWKRGILGKISVPFLLLVIILTGVIDIFPIFNDRYITLHDIPNNKAAAYIQKNTPRNSVFLNANFLYDPASLAGRKIYLGWPYFAWSAGYDTAKRDHVMKRMLYPSSLDNACSLYASEGIDFIETQIPNSYIDTPVNYTFFESNFQKVYYDPQTNFSIYNPVPTCSKITSVIKR